MSVQVRHSNATVARWLAAFAMVVALFGTAQPSMAQTGANCAWWAGGTWPYFMNITAPSAGTSWTPGSTRTITWTPTYGYVGNNQYIEYSSNDGTSWVGLATVSSGTRSYNWVLPLCISPSSTYRIRITEQGTYWYNCPGTSAQFSIGSSTVFSTQPQAQAVCVNTPVTFTVGLVGSFSLIEWRKDGIPVASGTTSFTIPSVQLPDSGFYSVRVVDACGRESISSTAKLTVRVPPSIVTQPTAVTYACENSVVTISVVASGSVLTYQWFQNGTPVPGGTSATLTIPNATTASSGTYTCTVSGACQPSVTTNAAVLNVVARPKITVEPQAQAVCPGGSTTLSIVATGTNLSYQWTKNGTNIPGANSAALSLTNFSYDMNGDYQCVISSSVTNPTNCPVTSYSAKVRVSGIRPPSITQQPAGADVCLGKSATLVAEAEGFDLQYQWFKDSVAVPNSNQNALTISNIKPAQSGMYWCRVTGTCGLNVNTDQVQVSAITSPAITAHPADQTVVLGNQLELTFTAADVRQVQWFKNSKPIAGATSQTFTIPAVTKADGGVYNAIITNTCGKATTNYATVTIKDPADDKPELTMATNMADFGEIPIGYEKDVTLTNLIKNSGTAVMQVNNVTVTGEGFSIVSGDNTPFNLDPGATSTVVVRSRPTDLGQRTGALQVVTNAPAPTGTVVLNATSVRRYSHAASLGFENVETGKSKELCITLTNTSNVDVTLDAASITGADAASFSLVTAMPQTITAGGTKEICVTFAPTSIGAKAASLDVTSSTGGNSALSLTGNGIVPTSVNESGEIVGVSVFPNPTTGSIVVRAESPITSVDVMSAAGQKVMTINGSLSTPTELRWNGLNAQGAAIPSGIYNVVVRTATQTITVPVAVVR